MKKTCYFSNSVFFSLSITFFTFFFLFGCKNVKSDITPLAPIAQFKFELLIDGKVKFTNLSLNSDKFKWNFGDGSVSTEFSPDHDFLENSDYNVKLFASNSTKTDSIQIKIQVLSKLIKNEVSDNIFICDDGGSCSLLNAKNGKLIWVFKTDEFILSSPTFNKNSLFFATSQNDSKHKILALDYLTGMKKWEYFTNDYNISSPLVVNDYLYYLSKGKLICLNPNSGKLIWEVISSNFIDSSPTFFENKVYFVSNIGLEIFDAKNGAKIKNAKIFESNTANSTYKNITGFGSHHSSPTIYKDYCYYTYDNLLYSYNLKTKESKTYSFKSKLPFDDTSSPTIVNDLLYINRNDGLYIINLPSLTIKKHLIKPKINNVNQSPLALENHVIYTSDEKMKCIDSKSFDQIWEKSGYFFSSANSFESIVYFCTNKELLAIDLLSGKTNWKYDLNSQILGYLPSPLIITKNGEAIHTAISGAQQ